MQRKQLDNGGKYLSATSHVRTGPTLMPFQMNTPTDLEKNLILASRPIFGGTVSTDTGSSATTQTETSSSSGDGTGTGTGGQTGNDTSQAGESGNNDPIAQYANDPKAIQSLLQQLNRLQTDLQKVSGERDGFLQKQQETERAQLNKEQQLAQDVQNLNNQVEQQHRVIEAMALKNAFLEQSDYQWNSVRQAMTELTEDDYQIDIDLANGNATVTGMENAVKSIAQKCPWLLKNKADTSNNTTSNRPPAGGVRRGSGAPPAPPTGNEGKQQKRADLIKKFPVIAGR